MWNSFCLPGVAKRTSVKRGSVSRIVKFGKEAEAILNASDDGIFEYGDEPEEVTVDYDSCISPSTNVGKSHSLPPVLMHLWSSSNERRMKSFDIDHDTSPDVIDDYDSCVSPASTPKWKVEDVEKAKLLTLKPSFRQMHGLLNDGLITHFTACPDGAGSKTLTASAKIPSRTVIISGSFNPLHHGHEALALRAMAEATEPSGAYYFEISTINVDKGPISASEMERRVDGIIKKGHSILLTNAIFFDAKAELFPQCIFAIGFDTYVRVINPKYYPKLTGGIDGMMARVEAKGCEFFVGGRITEGVYQALVSTPKGSPAELSFDTDVTFESVVETERQITTASSRLTSIDEHVQLEPMSPIFSGIANFRHDISSTEIRLKGIPPDV